MLSDNRGVNATDIAIVNGESLVRSIEVIQSTFDAPRLFLQVFNTNSPTVGTTAPEVVLPIPAGLTGQQMRFKYDLYGQRGGLQLSTGLAIAVTTTHDGAVAPTAGDEPDVKVDYQEI